MKNTAAGALMLSILAPIFVWLAIPNTEAALPVCCRRDGKHHCAMMAMMEELAKDATPSIRDSSSMCPYRNAMSLPSARSIAGQPVSFTFFTQTVSQSDRIVQALVSARVSEARSHLKRGPPALA